MKLIYTWVPLHCTFVCRVLGSGNDGLLRFEPPFSINVILFLPISKIS